MSLNIKNEKVHDLVRQLAELTGQSQTSAVEDAVRRRLDEIRNERDDADLQRKRRIRESIARLQALPDIGPSYEQIMDEMYDEMGLPR
ncbi:antitoxin VapB [Microbacterium sp. W4I4]|uniref:type II toxin-antitoxin system VapB family antitoxin n=1 Tax=Microbacterium sp. W4I4 TaxID=3042295 RepID=UPI00277E4749|nr:type II toxin-antitoxin system VapB family antitoxin [Microbacterium sp. W4I4]MDQ0614254.1 antitoxin VapB [Microbacterium sp. W4I4]